MRLLVIGLLERPFWRLIWAAGHKTGLLFLASHTYRGTKEVIEHISPRLGSIVGGGR